MRERIKQITLIAGRSIATLLLIALLAIVATSISPIYRFAEPQPFSGNDIFNPYRNIDTTHCWKRANFHTHTRVEGPLNECELWPEGVIEAYDKFGYDIVTFSNHNEITTHPNPELQVDLYEHGYNILKFHKLVFGPTNGVWHFDHLLPLLTSQRQWQIDWLTERCDLLQLNHPLRTPLTTKSMLERLDGYTIMELDSGRSVENEYWDTALSAGHYSFGLAGDDLHDPTKSSKIAIRCSFLGLDNITSDDILRTLSRGCYYSMRIPDYGAGDWHEKIEGNSHIPRITNIGVANDTIYASFSVPASRIVVYGQCHTTLLEELNTSHIEYCLASDEPYARIVAHFDQGEVIYTNPFARYDSAAAESPFRTPQHTINWVLTIVFNLSLILLATLIIWAVTRVWRAKRR
jgi:hypothetical protein